MLKRPIAFFQLIACVLAVVFCQTAIAQLIPLNDLSSFESKSNNWKIVGDAIVDLTKENVLTTTPGKGVLVCIPEPGKHGMPYELISKMKHGDLDIELDFMMAKGSNSGIYLQGNYEVQLLDSWGKRSPKYGDCGGIYERWDDSKPAGEQGYEGYAPRLNVCKAPGLWQHIRISYQAPRFDKAGKKIANAVFLKIELNGITVHENVEVSGPTRGSMTAEDVALGPLRFQGDHGALAIRNILVNNFDKKSATLSELSYKIYYGNYPETADLSKLTVADKGTVDALSWEILKESNNYALVYNGKFNAPTDGTYTVRLQSAGHSYLKVDGKEVFPNEWLQTHQFRNATLQLKAGSHTFEFFNNKRDGWLKPALGLWIGGPGFREVPFSTPTSSLAGSSSDPILVNATTNTILRSFMDFEKDNKSKSQRAVHTASVGSPSTIHYTYDLDRGAILQAWRGEFLNASPMWHDRGDGSADPRGSVTVFGNDMFLGKISGQSAWVTDTTGSSYRPKGYTVDAEDLPTFQYLAYGAQVTDRTVVVDDKYLERDVKLSTPVKGLMARLAEGWAIEKVAEGLYAVNGRSYYIQLSDKAVQPVLREINGRKELLVPAEKEVRYGILF